jgi:hypothetical protein
MFECRAGSNVRETHRGEHIVKITRPLALLLAASTCLAASTATAQQRDDEALASSPTFENRLTWASAS